LRKRILPLLFCFVLVAIATAQRKPSAGGPQSPDATPRVKGSLQGLRVSVFDTSTQSCELLDIPDAPARAFRDYVGTVHLVASHYVLRQNFGPTLENVQHSCDVSYDSVHDPNPADYNDSTWLDSFFSIDGKQVVALGHMEYHGWEHPGECHVQNDDQCWYNADTFHLSNDGGYHFNSFAAPANYVIGLPFKYEIDAGPEGYSVDTNIVQAGGWYYAMATDWPWPPNCTGEGGPHPCRVQFGAAPIRTSNLLDVTSWRGWSGTDFSVTFVDPYLGPVDDPEAHVYTPVNYMWYVNAINILQPSNLFVATLWDPWNTAYGPEGLYLSTSTDLVNWTRPSLVVTQEALREQEPKPGKRWSYGYFSLLDPTSPDANFSEIGDQPYVYYVRFDNDNPPYVRVLFRQPVQLTLHQ
jgi:hypothetical protein